MVRAFGHGRWLLVVAVVVVLAGCDWPAVGFGPQSTNFNPLEPALTESSVGHLTVAWSRPCACRERALAAGGAVYVVDGYTGNGPYSLTVRAFDSVSGKRKWSRPLGASSGAVVGAVANGLVYVSVGSPSGSDRLLALDAASGHRRWQLTPPAPGTGAVMVGPAIVDGSWAFVEAGVAAGRGEVSAIDTAGHVVWSAVPGTALGAFASDPVHRTLYVAWGDRPSGSHLTGYAEPDGTVRSAVVTQLDPRAAVVSLAFSDGLVYGTQTTGHSDQFGVGAFALHPDTGKLVWSGDISETVVTPKVVLDYSFTLGPSVARNASSGAVLWQAADIFPADAVAGNLVYGIGSTVDTVHIRRLSDGALVATLRSPAPGESFGSLTPAAGHLYDVTTTHLFAFAPSEKR